MEDMETIKNKVREAEREIVADSSPLPVDLGSGISVEDEDALPASTESPTERVQGYGSSPAPVSVDLAAPAVLKAAKASMDKASDLVNDPRKVDKRAKDLSDIADEMIENQFETERLKIKRAASANKVERKNIANSLYEAKQNGIRLRKEAKHKSKMQKQQHAAERKKAYWESHKDTLSEYGMREGSSRIACEILLWLDGVKGFFNGISKVSSALLKAIRWILIFAAITAVIMIIPATRNWILTLLGFIK